MLLNWILVSFAAALTTASTPEATSELAWQADYGVALEQCRTEERPLLVVLDDPSNEAKRVQPELLKNGEILNDYELCHIDISTEYGQRVAEVFRVKSFPHVAIIDRSGDVILNRMSGPITEGNWKSTLDRFKQGLRKSNSQRYRVSKPIVSNPIVSNAVGTVNSIYSYPTQNVGVERPYCPSCQLRN